MTAAYDRRIEQLLADAEAASGPTAWPRVEALLGAVVDLYGESLRRLLEHARAAKEGFDDRIAEDDLVASVLLLHDLHPVPLETRIARALAHLRDEAPDAAPIEVVSVEEGILTLRAPGKAPNVELVARAVEREAPELVGVRLVGTSSPALVPVERLRRGGAR